MVAASIALGLILQPALIQPAPLNQFRDGLWAGLELDRMTDSDLKKRFKVGKGAVRPEALKFDVDPRAAFGVEALLDGRGGKAVMRAIRLTPAGVYRQADLEKDLGQAVTTAWPRKRYESWTLLASPELGIVAEALDRGSESPTILSVYLSRPEAVKAILAKTANQAPPVEEVPDPGKNWDRVVEFGRSSASVTTSGDRIPEELNKAGKTRLEDTAVDILRSLRRGQVVYNRGGNGSFSVSVSIGKFNDANEANVTATATFDSNSPYGRLNESASETRKLKGAYRRGVESLVEDAVDSVIGALGRRIQKLGPPPASAFRAAEMALVMDDLSGLVRR